MSACLKVEMLFEMLQRQQQQMLLPFPLLLLLLCNKQQQHVELAKNCYLISNCNSLSTGGRINQRRRRRGSAAAGQQFSYIPQRVQQGGGRKSNKPEGVGHVGADAASDYVGVGTTEMQST